MERHVVHATVLGLAQLVARGEAAVGGQLTRRRAIARDVVLEHRQQIISKLDVRGRH
jgi:hypothetical protein